MKTQRELGYGTVYSLAPSPLSATEIWAGTDDSLIHLTRDGGKHWRNVSPDLGPWSKVTHIEASHFDAGEAWVAVDRHRLDDRHPYAYRTRDYGKTWALVVDGIPEPAFLNCVREDPKRKGLLYAGTEFGVYVSFDDAEHWQPLQLNLPVTSVRDLLIHGDDLIVATHGRAFWVLDNIASLRELSTKVVSSEAYLFPPARAVRINNDVFSGTPVPPDEPQAGNPYNGAAIDYFLNHDATEVTLSILDAEGKVVRRFSSKEKPPAMLGNLPIAPRWLKSSPQLSGQAGMHRWIWDLRYGRGAGIGDDSDDADGPPAPGPLVLPGTYRGELTVDGKEYHQLLTVKMDPRSIAGLSELKQQFFWAQKVYTSMISAEKTISKF